MAEKKVPVCAGCAHMKMDGRANTTGNNRHLRGPRGYCMCKHPDAFESFHNLDPVPNRLACFIDFTAPGGSVPQIKTSPKWCPLRERRKEAYPDE